MTELPNYSYLGQPTTIWAFNHTFVISIYIFIHFLHRDISPEYMENAQNTVKHYPVGPPSLNIGVAVSHVSLVYVLYITLTVSYIV